MTQWGRFALLLALCAVADQGGTTAQTRRASPGARSFHTTLTAAEMAQKQAVVETSAGPFVMALLPESAPNHVGFFLKLVKEGAYTGTTFHRVVKNGIVQGGDPLSKNPSMRALYGTGGLGMLDAEFNAEPMTAGAVAAVLLPDNRDSAGAQFFVVVTDQPALQGQYTIFGRVVDGLDVVRRISESAVDDEGKVVDRVTIDRITIRDAPPAEVEPFSTESVDELAHYRVVLDTTRGPITLGFSPDVAPMHVRNFLRLASLGAYDGTAFHRIVHGFVVQGGMLSTRPSPPPQRVQKYVRTLAPEFNATMHVKGTLSMARLDDPASAQTSFFICTGPAPSLDGKYTAFGKVIDGMSVVEALDATPVDGDTPRERVEVVKARVEKF